MRGRQAHGFTLLEVVVALTVAAIVGTLMVQLVGYTMVRSTEPVTMAQAEAQLTQVMENITVDYKTLVASHDDPLGELTTRIGAEGSHQSNGYGEYEVVVNHRITFAGNVEQASGGGNVQKVTLRFRGVGLTALFTR